MIQQWCLKDLLFCPLPEKMKMTLSFSTGRNLHIQTYFWIYFLRMYFAARTISLWSESLFTESRFCISLAVPSTEFRKSLLNSCILINFQIKNTAIRSHKKRTDEKNPEMLSLCRAGLYLKIHYSQGSRFCSINDCNCILDFLYPWKHDGNEAIKYSSFSDKKCLNRCYNHRAERENI